SESQGCHASKTDVSRRPKGSDIEFDAQGGDRAEAASNRNRGYECEALLLPAQRQAYSRRRGREPPRPTAQARRGVSHASACTYRRCGGSWDADRAHGLAFRPRRGLRRRVARSLPRAVPFTPTVPFGAETRPPARPGVRPSAPWYGAQAREFREPRKMNRIRRNS